MKPDDPKSRNLYQIPVVLSAALLLYVLSTGPMSVLYDRIHSRQIRQVIDTAYAPISWLYVYTPFNVVMDGYLQLWE